MGSDDNASTDRAWQFSPQLAGPFASDPGRSEAWWWLGIPLAILAFVFATYMLARDWYMMWMYPEGYGALELSHFLVPLTASILAVTALRRPWVRKQRALFVWIALLALGCFYIAGEEHSWGQHFLHWGTPDYWSSINSQNETNLHNTFDLFGNGPRLVLELAIIFGGILYPLACAFYPQLRSKSFDIIMPPVALVPTAVLMLAIKIYGMFEKAGLAPGVLGRTSEVQETYIYLFLLFGVIILRRRISERASQSTAS